MKYFGYKFDLFLLVGTDSRQIIDTMGYYRNVRGKDVAVPSEPDIFDVGKLEIECMFSMYCPHHFIDVSVSDSLSFRINANAFGYVRDVAQHYGELKRGSLYKFAPPLLNVSPFGPIALYYLPESVMRGLKDHDWGQHNEQIKEWLGGRESVLDDMLDSGLLERRVENPMPVRKKHDYSKN